MPNLGINWEEPPCGSLLEEIFLEMLPGSQNCQLVPEAPWVAGFSNLIWDCTPEANLGIKLGSVPWWRI